MIVNLTCILLTASARDDIPILCIEQPCASEADHQNLSGGYENNYRAKAFEAVEVQL